MRIIINESQLGIISSLLKESADNHIFYDYLYKYGASYVFNEFINNPKGNESWLPLIDPNMYYKALSEFSKYGKFVKFPSKYVYQWMGIIMKNTAKLIANTDIAGHSSHFPIEECEEFLESWFNDGRYIEVNANDDVILELSVNEVYNICNSGKLNEAIDSNGQEYFSFMNQSDVDVIEKNDNISRFKNANKVLISMVDKYNNKDMGYKIGNIEVDYKHQRFLLHCDVYSLLDDLGIYDWMTLPDGSDGWSDFGLSPLCVIIDEYNEDLEPEKVLVLVNRCLDVYHQRGDLSSIFIKGGASSLNRISGLNESFTNESNHCIICGSRIGDNNISGIGSECMSAIRYAKKMTMNDEDKLYYNWIIQANIWKEVFIDAFKDVKFKNSFNQSFYNSICKSERISKKQLDIILDKLRQKLLPNQFDKISERIEEMKDAFLDKIDVTREDIEIARNIIRKKKGLC